MNRRTALSTLAAAGAGLLFTTERVWAQADTFQSGEAFRLDFGADVIADLHRRIDATRWPEIPIDTGWSEGTDDQVLRNLVEYWRNDYDWLAVQSELNQLDHRRVEIEGEGLHFVRYAAQGGGSFPLLLLHGWPGSFHEFSHGAPLLAGGAGAVGYEVIVPSLPGFVFSDPPRERGMNPGRIAERLHLLMTGLGHERYGVQGGDWGAIIGTQLARRHPEAVAGLHLNFITGGAAPEGADVSAEEREYREYRSGFQAEETG